MYKIRRVRSAKQIKQLQELDHIIFVDRDSVPRTTWWLVFDDNDCPVGFAGVSLQSYYTAFLCRCGLLDVARGRGLQRRLIRVREKFCRSRQIKRIVTYVYHDNLASANNLCKEGYRLFWPKKTLGADRSSLYFEKRIR